MTLVPFEIIKAAKKNDIEAAEAIKKQYEGYIARLCMQSYEDENGKIHTYPDEDLRYFAENALYAAIFTFQFSDPPDDFEP
jgi:hypothetical protein